MLLDLRGGQTASTEPALPWLELLEAMLETSGTPSVTALSSRQMEEDCSPPTRIGRADREEPDGFLRILSCFVECPDPSLSRRLAGLPTVAPPLRAQFSVLPP